MKKPLVAIWMLAYNHENYIEMAVESIMAQQADFPFKLYLSEDYSPDETREKCKALEKKYPDRIDLFLPTQNIGITGKNNIGIQTYNRCLKSGAEYITLCEGDDYWTDPYKLQKQVDLMIAHPNCSMVLTNAEKLVDNELTSFYPATLPPSEFNLKQFLTERYPVPTCTALFKREVMLAVLKGLAQIEHNFFHFDFFLWCAAGQQGNYRFLNEKTAVYRVHASSIVRSTSRRSTLDHGMNMNHFLAEYLGIEHRTHFLSSDWWYHLEYAFMEIEERNWFRSFKFLSRSLITATRYGWKNQVQILRDYFYRLKQSLSSSKPKNQ